MWETRNFTPKIRKRGKRIMVEYECYVCGELIKEKDLVITGAYNGSPDYYHKKCWIKEKGKEE